MLFNSLHFVIFFIIVTGLYFVLPHKYRWQLLLLSSCYFYMAFLPIYILILGFTIVIDYFAGLYIEKSEGKRRKLFLIFSLIANIGVLAIFKYYNFLNGNLSVFLNNLGYENQVPDLSILLPIGLSFHTFQAMSYTIEVYRGKVKAERNFGIYALYVMFYPQLVAGPIERPQNVIPQFYEKYEFDYSRVADGLKQMAWGMFKKVVIADRLAVVTDQVFNSPQSYPAITLALAVFFFSFQIYCDFSGYSDIALGSAKVMGFRLMKNFDRPYSSRSISEFWTRWHISLSSWFKDYLYIPLGGSRVTMPRWYFNLFFVFLVSGLWHGANWTFIIWGALHGFYLIFGIITAPLRQKIKSLTRIDKFPRINGSIQVLTTFVLVTVAWVFFRTNGVKNSIYILKTLPYSLQEIYVSLVNRTLYLGELSVSIADLLFCLFLIAFLETIQYLQNKYNLLESLKTRPVYMRWAFYYSTVLAIIYLGVFDNRQFIYFQF
jgi:alginate O-acetyltransferase complex protein AlgI